MKEIISEFVNLLNIGELGPILFVIVGTTIIIIAIAKFSKSLLDLVVSIHELVKSKAFSIIFITLTAGLIYTVYYFYNSSNVPEPKISVVGDCEKKDPLYLDWGDCVEEDSLYVEWGDFVVKDSLYVEWEFNDKYYSPQTIRYEVKVYDEDGKLIWKKITPTKNIVIKNTGKIALQVNAISSGEVISESKIKRVEYYNNTLEKIRKTKTLSVGIHTDFTEGKFSFTDEYGNYIGFNIDLSQLIAEQLKTSSFLDTGQLKVRYKYFVWPDAIASPKRSDIDIAIANISIVKDREKNFGILFSEPYFETTLGMIGTRQALEQFNNRSIRDLRIGAIKDTTAEMFYFNTLVGQHKLAIKENLTSYKDNITMFSELSNNEIDLVLYDYIRGIVEVENNTAWALEAVSIEEFGVLPEMYGITINNEDPDLKNYLDKIILNNTNEITSLKTKYKINIQD